MRSQRLRSFAFALAAGTALIATPAFTADVTPDRLVNADKEPQNWLMNHRTYDGQRFSPLSRINRENVKNLKLAFAVPLGGQVGNAAVEATPLAENGFLYITDSSGVLYKIDTTSGRAGRIVWTIDPKQDRPLMNRGAALWGNLVISPANWPARIIATDKDTGKVAWETNVTDGQPQLGITAAPLVIKDRVIVGASLGDLGLRDWIAGLDAATGKVLWRKYTVPAPGEPGSETWKGTNNAWQTGGGAVWVTGTYDPDTNQTFWGTGNPAPQYDPKYRPGDNLYTDSVISLGPVAGSVGIEGGVVSGVHRRSPSPSDHQSGCAESRAGYLRSSFLRNAGRADFLRNRYCAVLRTGRILHRPHSQRRNAHRPAATASLPVRSGREPQYRHGAWSCDTPIDSAARRRGDRVKKARVHRAGRNLCVLFS
jgi:hypothetical protein